MEDASASETCFSRPLSYFFEYASTWRRLEHSLLLDPEGEPELSKNKERWQEIYYTVDQRGASG